MRPEWLQIDYYAALGVKATASDEEITKAYRKLARQHHPDSQGGDEESFKKLSSAYAVIGNSKQRKEYDEARRLGKSQKIKGSWDGSGFGYQGNGSSYEQSDYDSIMREMIHTFFQKSDAGLKGQDKRAVLSITFEDAVKGLTTSLIMKDGSEERVYVNIPAGVKNNQTIRVAGKGTKGTGGAPDGDLYITLRVGEDPAFKREGNNLITEEKVPFTLLALGGKISIPDFDGNIIKLKIPPGTQASKVFRVKRRGIKAKNAVGDLLIKIQCVIPTSINSEQKKLLEKLDKSLSK